MESFKRSNSEQLASLLTGIRDAELFNGVPTRIKVMAVSQAQPAGTKHQKQKQKQKNKGAKKQEKQQKTKQQNKTK